LRDELIIYNSPHPNIHVLSCKIYHLVLTSHAKSFEKPDSLQMAPEARIQSGALYVVFLQDCSSSYIKEKDGLTWKNEENKDNKYLSNFVNLVKQSNDMA
jgi:hypothetical protein